MFDIASLIFRPSRNHRFKFLMTELQHSFHNMKLPLIVEWNIWILFPVSHCSWLQSRWVKLIICQILAGRSQINQNSFRRKYSLFSEYLQSKLWWVLIEYQFREESVLLYDSCRLMLLFVCTSGVTYPLRLWLIPWPSPACCRGSAAPIQGDEKHSEKPNTGRTHDRLWFTHTHSILVHT